MITLYQPPPVWGIPSMSPFCVKLETYLRMTNQPYKTAPGNPFQAPKGKVPYVDIDGKKIGDSDLIIQYLKTQKGDPLDGKLTKEQKASAMALQRMTEDHLYFASAWLRWNSDESWPHVKEVFIKLLPPVVGGLILGKIKKTFLRNLNAQGMGRHTREEILRFAKDDLNAVSTLLGDRPFFLGDQASTIDATMYGFLVQLIWVPWNGPLQAHARSLQNLVAFCERMKAQYWSEPS